MWKQISQVCPHYSNYTEDAFDAEKVTIQEFTQEEKFQKEYYPKNPQAQKSKPTSNSKSRA
jgi:hypothetical protein